MGRVRRFGRLAALGASLLAVTAAHAAEPVSVDTSVDRTEAAVGDPIRYAITVKHPPGVEVAFPEIGDTVVGLHVERRGTEPDRRDHGLVVTKRWYELSTMSVGTYTIPASVMTYHEPNRQAREVSGAAVTVTVKSVLPAQWESEDIRDIKPPIPIRGRWWWLGLGLLAAVGAGLAIWWSRRRDRRTGVTGPPPRLPHEVALEALEVLRSERLPAQGRYEEYYVRLSDVVRRYVEQRFTLRAPEMTTEEFLQVASHHESLTQAQRQLLRDFLMHCDLVKFARYQPSEQEAGEMFTAAARFVQETTPAEEPSSLSNATRG